MAADSTGATASQNDEIDVFSALLGSTLTTLKDRPVLVAATVVGAPTASTVNVTIAGVAATARFLAHCVMKDKDEVRALQTNGGLLVIGVLAK